jgi:HEPN domain-containing protein
MLPIDEVADVLVCFHAQQAVEKALKAVLAARGGGIPCEPS